MGRKELGHSKGTDAIIAEDLEMVINRRKKIKECLSWTNLGHLLVRHEELLVFRVLQVVLFDVGPELLDAFGTAGFLLANDV